MIGTITFHWATNFGAVLQAYALQKALQSLGYETEIINYVPKRTIILQKVQQLKNRDFLSIKKEKFLLKFREDTLKMSRKYDNHKQLSDCYNKYSAIICGSDQVWNQGFTLRGEGSTTLSYFLDFASETTKKIAYAVSFGTDLVSEEYISTVNNEIKKFSNVSVREESGISILNQFGIEGRVVCDPTVLLERKDYLKLVERYAASGKRVFPYLLHKNQTISKKISAYIMEKYAGNQSVSDCFDIYEWIYHLAYSDCVVTNSFHGIMMAIILNTQFIALPVEGSSMNNRVHTILKHVGLEDRLVSDYNEELIDRLMNDPINWCIVNKQLDLLRNQGKHYLTECLGAN